MLPERSRMIMQKKKRGSSADARNGTDEQYRDLQYLQTAKNVEKVDKSDLSGEENIYLRARNDD